MIERIKAIFFDSDNTLVNHKECEKQALQFLFENIGENFKSEYHEIFRPLDRKLWDSVALNERTDLKEKEIQEYRFKLFFDKIGINYSDFNKANRFFQEGLQSSVALMENAEEIIKYLYDKKYKLYVVTNGLVKLQKPRIVNSSISSFISDIIVSEEVGARKPDPVIFNTLLQRYDFVPKDVVMIGDSLEKDIKGAQNALIKSVWFNPLRKENDTEIKPDYEINSLLDLKQLL